MANFEEVVNSLKPVIRFNTDEHLRGILIDTFNNTFVAGFRRIYGAGTCLTIARHPVFDPQGYVNKRGLFTFSNNDHYIDAEVGGLLGKISNSPVAFPVHRPFGNGRYREVVGIDRAREYVGDVYRNIFEREKEVLHYTLLINPEQIQKFIESKIGEDKLENKLVVIQGMGVTFTAEQHRPAKVVEVDKQLYIEYKKDELALINFNNSSMSQQELYRLVNKFAVIKKVGEAETKNGMMKQVVVQRPFQPGIRMAVYSLQNGIKFFKRHPDYTVVKTDNREVGVFSEKYQDFSFIKGQEQYPLLFCPKIVMSADELWRMACAFAMVKQVKMSFSSQANEVLFENVRESDNDPEIVMITGCNDQLVQGKIWTR